MGWAWRDDWILHKIYPPKPSQGDGMNLRGRAAEKARRRSRVFVAQDEDRISGTDEISRCENPTCAVTFGMMRIIYLMEHPDSEEEIPTLDISLI
jgi:hypothetical protein